MTITEITYGQGGYDPTMPNKNIISVQEIESPEPVPAAIAAVARWRSMGFSDDEIIAMAPALADAVTYTPTD
jgi:hypothetical protein